MKKILTVLLTATLLIASSAYAEGTLEEAVGWNTEQLTEQYMHSITKQKCMDKTLATLKAGCNDATCLKNISGITGDCVTWAKGDENKFCGEYKQTYMLPYCSAKVLTGNQCIFLYVGYETLCKNKK